jgi:hypothetical protein
VYIPFQKGAPYQVPVPILRFKIPHFSFAMAFLWFFISIVSKNSTPLGGLWILKNSREGMFSLSSDAYGIR